MPNTRTQALRVGQTTQSCTTCSICTAVFSLAIPCLDRLHRSTCSTPPASLVSLCDRRALLALPFFCCYDLHLHLPFCCPSVFFWAAVFASVLLLFTASLLLLLVFSLSTYTEPETEKREREREREERVGSWLTPFFCFCFLFSVHSLPCCHYQLIFRLTCLFSPPLPFYRVLPSTTLPPARVL